MCIIVCALTLELTLYRCLLDVCYGVFFECYHVIKLSLYEVISKEMTDHYTPFLGTISLI